MMDGMMGGGWIMMLLGFVLFVLVVAALVAGVVYLARGRNSARGSPTGQAPGDDSARRSLDERYARGEIDTDEYEERRRHLSG